MLLENVNFFGIKLLIPKFDNQFFGDGEGTGEGADVGQGTGSQDGNGTGQQETQTQTQQQPLTLDAVTAFLNESEEGKKYLQSFTDTRVTDAIKTYESKTLPKKIEDEIAKRYPPESEEAKQLRELKAQFEQSQREAAREKLLNTALSTATEKGLPTKLVEFFVGEDADKTTANLSVLEAEFQAAVQAEVDKRFKENGTPPPAKGGGTGTLTKEDVLKMSPDEINANWDEIVKNKLL